jgi:chromosome segregation protein
VLKEFQEVSERDQFLLREIEDLSKSMVDIESLIKDLKTRLETEFTNGIVKINKEFQRFFELMFGGGNAKLSLVDVKKRKYKSEDEDDEESEVVEEVDEEAEQGIDIGVSLPKKKVKELTMLSGGERSLTSIALLFAISQVNPPPFLVLDETDAALDESNSRKYGDMIETLANYSQLLVVTHNRETMSRASVLYGVTLGADDASRLLSVKFDDAVAIAK